MLTTYQLQNKTYGALAALAAANAAPNEAGADTDRFLEMLARAAAKVASGFCVVDDEESDRGECFMCDGEIAEDGSCLCGSASAAAYRRREETNR